MNQRAQHPVHTQSGFTLLELLISMALLGFILVLLFGGLRLGVRSWDAVQQQVDNLNTVRSVESFLRREMALAYPYRWKSVSGQRIAFLGERNKIRFVVQLPSRVGVGGLYIVSLELEQSDRGKRMLWKHLPLSPLMQDFSELDQAAEMVLVGSELSAVDEVWLSYFGQEGEDTAPRWVDRWDSLARLPALIKIQVRFANGTEWPDFVVAPMLASEQQR
jgi:general secretion pathway protein J